LSKGGGKYIRLNKEGAPMREPGIVSKIFGILLVFVMLISMLAELVWTRVRVM